MARGSILRCEGQFGRGSKFQRGAILWRAWAAVFGARLECPGGVAGGRGSTQARRCAAGLAEDLATGAKCKKLHFHFLPNRQPENRPNRQPENRNATPVYIGHILQLQHPSPSHPHPCRLSRIRPRISRRMPSRARIRSRSSNMGLSIGFAL